MKCLQEEGGGYHPQRRNYVCNDKTALFRQLHTLKLLLTVHRELIIVSFVLKINLIPEYWNYVRTGLTAIPTYKQLYRFDFKRSITENKNENKIIIVFNDKRIYESSEFYRDPLLYVQASTHPCMHHECPQSQLAVHCHLLYYQIPKSSVSTKYQ